MKNLLESKTYIRLYTYSKKHLPFRLLERVGLSGVDKVSLLSTLTTFGLPLIIGALIYYPSDIFKLYPDKTPFYLIYTVLVAFSVWFGGLTTGIITTGIISIESFFLFRPPLNDAEVTGIFTTQLALFAGSGIILSFLINFARRTQEIEKLKQREKTYAQNLAKLHVEYLKAREEIRARDEFLSIASHELKTPLTTMLLKLHKMLNDIRNVSLANFSVSELMKVLENGEQQINALKARINDLLDISLITTGRMSLERKKTDLVAVTRRVKESFSEMLKRDGYILNIETKSAVIGHWDETRIEQVIANLLSNAIKYGRKKPINIKIFNSRFKCNKIRSQKTNKYKNFQQSRASEVRHHRSRCGHTSQR
ncbi:HAMP domain-containing histidine kinase [Candidatus Roizmanbacteria bacterium]|nr:HAMP domain-containing histidine kinase [Candidatus Roizmanbacteria bacterium]